MRIFAFVLGTLFFGCSTSNDNRGDAGLDASGPDGSTSCASLVDLRVNDPCTTPQTQVCFRQCQNDGCFCKSARWTCVNDFSCLPEAGPLVDSGADDATTDDAGDSAGADALADAPQDAPADAPSDASDGSSDAGADG